MLWGGNLLLADEKYTESVEEAAQDLSRVPRLVDENGAPRYLIVEFSKTEAEQPAQDCTVQAAAQGEKTKGLRDACKMKGLTKTQILALHAAMVRGFGGTDGLRNESLLDSALNAPFQAFSGAEAYPSIL